MQKERGSSRSLSLPEEIEREAREIEKEMMRHPELDDIQVTEEMDAALLKKIQAYEEELEEEREAVKKVEENLRRNHYLSASDADAGSRAGTGNAVRHFRVPGDSVEFSAELMPEIPRGFGLGGGDAGKARNSAGSRDVVSGYVGQTQESRAGYTMHMEEGVSGYAGSMEEAGSGYSGHMEVVSAYGENEKEIASEYGENIEDAMPGYGERMEAAGAKSVSKDAGVRRFGPELIYVGQEEEPGEGKVLYRRKKRKYWLFSLAAVIVIVMGFGVTSVGSKSHWKVFWDKVLGNETIQYIDSEDMDSQETNDGNELEAYREIEDKFHIRPVRIRNRPDDMKLDDYQIQEEILRAELLYKYKDEVIRFYLYMNELDSSLGQNEEDYKIDEYIVSTNGVEIKVEEFKKPENSINRQEANFEYQGVHYQLKGVMEKGEFKEILENLYFF